MTAVTVTGKGSLEKYGSHTVHASTPAEAIRGISSQIKGFKRDIELGTWRVARNDKDIGTEGFSLSFGTADKATIIIEPVPSGGKGGVGKIIGGAALITAAYFTGGMAAGAAGMLSTAAHAGVMIGASMMLSGTSQLLTKTPKTNSDSTTSYNFNGPVNTGGQGVGIPQPIGLRIITGSVVASAEVVTE